MVMVKDQIVQITVSMAVQYMEREKDASKKTYLYDSMVAPKWKVLSTMLWITGQKVTLRLITDCALLKDCARRFIMGIKQTRITMKHIMAKIQSPNLVAFDFIMTAPLPNAPFAELLGEGIGRNQEYDANHRLEQPNRRSIGELEGPYTYAVDQG